MEEVKSEIQNAAEVYSRIAMDAGQLQFQIREQLAQLEELFIKMRNARVDYLKAMEAETKAHKQEATENKEVTQ